MKTILIILTLFLTQLSFSQKQDSIILAKKNIKLTNHYFNSHKKSNTFFLFLETK